MNTLTVKFQNSEVSEAEDNAAESPAIHPSGNYDEAPGYAPANFLDSLIAKGGLKNDAALSRFLNVAPPVISKVRHAHLPVTNNLLVRIHDVFGISINDLRRMLGV